MKAKGKTGQPPTRVMVVDDEPAICRLVADILKPSEEFTLVAHCHDPAQALEMVSRVRPDIVVIDVRMPGMSGLESMERIRVAYPEMKFLLVTGMLDTLSEEEKAAAWRANGFLRKPFTIQEFVSALKSISCGDFVRSSEVESFLLASMQNPATDIQRSSYGPAFHWHPDLSSRENEVARLLCEHPTEIDKQIANRLRMSLPTFRTHVQNIFKKLNAHSRAEAVQKLTRR